MKKIVRLFMENFQLVVNEVVSVANKIDNFILKIGDRNPDFAKLWIISTTIYLFIWLLSFANLAMAVLIAIKRDTSLPSWVYTWVKFNFSTDILHPTSIGIIGILSSIYLVRIIYGLTKK